MGLGLCGGRQDKCRMNTKAGFRKLKEQQSKRKIDHPLAKYNNLGQVTCIVCNLPLKNELLWPSHLLSKKHKEAVAALKIKASDSRSNSKKTGSVVMANDGPPAKRKKEEISNPRITNKPPNQGYNATKDESHSQITGDPIRNALPANFFDNSSSADATVAIDTSELGSSSNKVEESSAKTPTTPKVISEALPEGFFDDAKMDAKVRKVEYVDKKEEEWAEFQKMVAEETKVSDNIQAEEEETITVERDLAEHGALKQYLTRVSKLKEQREQHKHIVSDTKESWGEQQDENGSADSEDELDDILNWRAKKA